MHKKIKSYIIRLFKNARDDHGDPIQTIMSPEMEGKATFALLWIIITSLGRRRDQGSRDVRWLRLGKLAPAFVGRSLRQIQAPRPEAPFHHRLPGPPCGAPSHKDTEAQKGSTYFFCFGKSISYFLKSPFSWHVGWRRGRNRQPQALVCLEMTCGNKTTPTVMISSIYWAPTMCQSPHLAWINLCSLRNNTLRQYHDFPTLQMGKLRHGEVKECVQSFVRNKSFRL